MADSIGFIGLGVMGRSMAGHLLEAGHSLRVYNRTRSKARDLEECGAAWADSPRELARSCAVVFTIVGFPKDVEEVYRGEQGLLAGLKPGGVLVDMTTSSPRLAAELAAEAREKGGEVLDAPVSGGDKGAREAKLSIMVGGNEAAFNRVLPLFEVMGETIVYQGEAGKGQSCKLVNQVAIAAGMAGVCEALALALRAGLDPATVLRSISGGAAGSWSLNNLAPRMLEGDFAPGFYVKHFIKDMRLAAESARELGLNAPALDLVLRLYEELESRGYGEEGTQALFRLYQRDERAGHAGDRR